MDHEYDFLIIGSGGGGMTAALMANSLGLSTLVVEKTAFYGGSTARSGGAIWVPNNILMAGDGVEDSWENGRLYMSQTVGDRVPQKLQDAYLTHAPEMVAWLRDNTAVQFQRTPGYADYHPERPGGVAASRSLEPVPFDGTKLGEERALLRKPMAEVPGGLAITGSDYQKIGMFTSTWEGKKSLVNAGLDWMGNMLRGRRMLTMGQALSGRLRYAMIQADIPLWLNSGFEELILEDGRIVGAIVRKDGQCLPIRARKGVLLAAGGFPLNLEMRQKYLPAPQSIAWTVACEGNTGEAIQAGIQLGAATDLMDDAWWGPSSAPPGEAPFFHVGERGYPGGIMVNGLGQRFVNESASYVDVVHTMYEKQHAGSPHIPAYFIFDQRYRGKYMFGLLFPGMPIPQRHRENGYILSANSIRDLAALAGINARALVATVERFNQFAETGADLDFGRGRSAYDNYYGDPTVGPNPNLAPLVKPPFYAVKMWPGDLGTKGGLVTDEWARVLRANGSSIPGLFATGNSMASIMGNSYPGAGATIGPAMTFGYLAAQKASDLTG